MVQETETGEQYIYIVERKWLVTQFICVARYDSQGTRCASPSRPPRVAKWSESASPEDIILDAKWWPGLAATVSRREKRDN